MVTNTKRKFSMLGMARNTASMPAAYLACDRWGAPFCACTPCSERRASTRGLTATSTDAPFRNGEIVGIDMDGNSILWNAEAGRGENSGVAPTIYERKALGGAK